MKALAHEDSLKEMSYYSVDNKQIGNISFSGQRQYAQDWAGLGGKPRLIKEVTARLQRQNLRRLRGVWPDHFGIWP